ncbi:MAG: mannose-1-phosphate guanylyltransferase [Bacteroidales bacterium]|nr:mannose-1-phosphate guanylyltransferase [Bacteroidales bacterium]
MHNNNYCVIMAGGIGARFWPMSRTSRPKQFIDILGTGKTLIQQTFERFLPVCPKENIYIVTNEMYKQTILDQLDGIREDQVLCEPMRRNTAPAIAYAAYKIREINPEAKLVVAPSDHIILKEDRFTEIIEGALKAAGENNWLLTLGIKPSRPDTGYGYIQFEDGQPLNDDNRIRKVKTFTEKPNLELAKTFLESGDFLWNSGIFIWSLKSIIEAFEEHLPDVSSLFEEGKEAYNTSNEEDFINKTYPVCKNISIDYGVMEKAQNVYVMAADFGWSDLGTWGSLYDIRSKDENQNAVIGKQVMTFNTENCIVNMPKDKLVVLQGLDGFIVVEQDDVLLVCKKQDEQNIRDIVNAVKLEKGEKFV